MGDAVAWAQLSKGRTTLSTKLIAIQWISDCKTFYAIHRIEIHPLDNVVQPSNLFSRLNPSLRGLGGGEGGRRKVTGQYFIKHYMTTIEKTNNIVLYLLFMNLDGQNWPTYTSVIVDLFFRLLHLIRKLDDKTPMVILVFKQRALNSSPNIYSPPQRTSD